MAPPNPPAKRADCSEFLPDQSKWSHENKLKLAGEAKKVENKRKPEDYQHFFDVAVEPLNQLARDLQLGDVFFLLALAAHESSWLNVENDWLNNLFGTTKGGGDNHGYDTIQQGVNYWKCQFGPFVKGVKNMDDFVQGLKNAKYNPNEAYYSMKKWNDMITSIRIRYEKFGYEKVDDKGTWVLRKKTAK